MTSFSSSESAKSSWMTGSIAHGAVVAREYGIPVVVGVPNATERISTGQRITVDGSAGTVSLVT